MTSQSGSKIAFFAAISGNLIIGIIKFIAAAITGSSAMISEGIHSLVDTGNCCLLLLGMRRFRHYGRADARGDPSDRARPPESIPEINRVYIEAESLPAGEARKC
jgi:hypothetical protein